VIEAFLKRKANELLLFILIFSGGIYATTSLNISEGKLIVPGRIWSDAAHYYVYMPATFIYHWDVYRFPYQIEKKFAGFTLNNKTGKVEIKTTCGISLLQTPFFLAAHAISLVFGLPTDGFSFYYQLLAMIGAVFYFTLALFFLKRFLDHYLPVTISILSILLITFTTQAYFYAYQSVLMSHIYSFFLFSLFLYLLKRFLDSEKKPWGLYILLCLDIALAVLVRPTNLIIILWFGFLDTVTWNGFYRRLMLFMHPLRILLLAAIQIMFLIPQFIYWKYLTGSYIFYSYPGEIFFWADPQLIKEWISPLNGLFPYHPVFIFFIAGIFIMIRKRKSNGLFALAFFLLISYVISSWHCWYYGGSFGARPFTEYIPFMALPFGYFLMSLRGLRNLFLRSCMVVVFIALIYFNLMQAYSAWCFDGGTWEWDTYFRIMKRHELLVYNPMSYTYKNDFQNIGLQSDCPATTIKVRSRVLSTYCDQDVRTNINKSWQLLSILDRPLSTISAEVWINKDENRQTGASMELRIESGRQTVFSRSLDIDNFVLKKNRWYRVSDEFGIPPWIDQNISNFKISIENPKGSKFFIDDLQLGFR
jgi:hypothetical protein